jgi:2-ketocyclohexanecarboxyl-CoA hydrolase
MNYEDILYEVRNGAAWITINRPDKMNAFRGRTCDELIHALNRAGYAPEVGAIVTTGAAPSGCRWKNCTAPSATCPSP